MKTWLRAVCWLVFVAGTANAADLTATSRSPVHPVLIRNEHNSLLQVAVDAKADGAKVTSLTFSLDGTMLDDDVEAVRLFFDGSKSTNSTKTPFGDEMSPAASVTFRGEQALAAGQNVFWLSCRLKPTADLSHSISATCSEVQTSTGAIAPQDQSPGSRHRIGIALRKHNDDGVHTYRIPALATSAKGSLLCVYDMRRRASRDLQEDIDIGLSRSTDGGRTWESPRVIMDMGEFNGLPQEQNGCSDPGIIVDRQTGEIFVFAVWMWGKPGKHQWRDDGSEPGYEIGKAAQMLVVRSKDDGLTWSKPENLTRKLKKEAWWLYAPAPQQGFQLADGTLVMPSQGRDEQGKSFSTIMTSRDHGETWTSGAPAYSGGSECQAAELGDGSIMLNIRNDHDKFRAVFVTRDLGQTWQPHETNRKAIIEPTCNGSLLRVDFSQRGEQRHVLLFANPQSQKARERHTIQVSFDDGRTWPESHRLLLDEGKGRGYPSLTRIDDRHIGIVYEGSQSDVMFEKLSLFDDLIPPDRSPLGANDKVRIAIIGDSTAASYPKPPAETPDLTGWGQVFGEYFNDRVTVLNHAASGRSSKSFRAERRWQPVLDAQPDFVFIQFGHNDQKGKGPERETDATSSYQENLRRYITDARAAGARPVLVTPVARRIFAEGKPTSTLTPYADAVHKVGRELQVPVVELHAASFALFGKLGDEGSADFSPSTKDRTHFSRKGALEIARLVADRVPESLRALRMPASRSEP